jgi:hypothetical protein
MSDPKPKEKVEEEKQERPPKPPGYRKFEKLLKQVVKAPPLRTHKIPESS